MQNSEDSVRQALGVELSDLMYRQKAMILCNERVGAFGEDFIEMADEDERQHELLETVIINYGVRSAPRRSTEQIADILIDAVVGETAKPIEKLGAYILLKKHQLMASELIKKCTGKVLPDIKLALSPLEGLPSVLDRQLARLQSFAEHSGVSWITGRDVTDGLLTKAKNAISSVGDQIMPRQGAAPDLDILAVLGMDHRKVDMLFQEIENSPTHERARGIFRQLYADLDAHSIAEEETVYPRFQDVEGVRDFPSESRQEHADMRILLEDAVSVQDEHEAFLDKVDELRDLVREHVAREEKRLFKLIRENSSEDLRRELVGQFQKAKQRLQEQVGQTGAIARPSGQASASAQF